MTRTPRAPGRRTAAAVALVCALTATVQAPARADPEPTTLTGIRERVERLYHDAEAATDQYNLAGEKVTAKERRVRELDAEVAAAEARLARLTTQAGAAARAQYRGGGLPAEVQFVLSGDPERALDTAAVARQAQQSTRRVLTALAETRGELEERRASAAAELRTLRSEREKKAAHRATVEKRIAAAEAIEARLAEDQRRRLAALEKERADASQEEWERTGVLDRAPAATSDAGREAVAYATRQLGKPYVWGAVGPGSFDCSGLTSKAWLAAGVPIPRTSQEQWRLLPRVPVEDMRPGDLIIYYAGATHVGLYIGDGKIIHAPRPGRWVTEAPAGSMEILGVVRPDAG
ncbi:C40 family peptidase [Streptomyces tagetis]|uniref:C40 family peptidase n=1 Tax=Streptomyces tagetis TaxID=2820809 RepID=A0A941B2T1_9ACTN|nr:C40 family peptidase [Streptomyces sp. RG38]MBQ0827517.1 C40 family peptidase [Streptomyces sp. RG38]